MIKFEEISGIRYSVRRVLNLAGNLFWPEALSLQFTLAFVEWLLEDFFDLAFGEVAVFNMYVWKTEKPIFITKGNSAITRRDGVH